MAIRLIERETKVGALVLVRNCVGNLTQPDGLGGYLNDIRDLLGIITYEDENLVTIDTRSSTYGEEYKRPHAEEFTVIDSDLSEEKVHSAIDAFNAALGI